MKKLLPLNENGTILLVFIMTLPFLIAISLNNMSLGLTSFQVARKDQLHTAAQLAADAGADYAVGQISQDNAWTSTGGEVTLHSDSKHRTTYQATITGDDDAKTLAVTGRTYWPASSTTASRSVSIVLDLRPVNSALFSVISGAGGLFMSNSSKVVGGDVFINGEISMSNSSQIGLSTSPVNVRVAHQICPNPADATYPRVCTAGELGQPISLNNTAHIYGEVRATNQTSGSGMSNTGLVAGSTVAPQALPTHDRNSQIAAVTNNMTAAAASCSSDTTKTWPANTKITGDVNVSKKCKVTVEGNVWITGDLSISNNNTEVKVANALGATRPNIMVDGSSGISVSNSGSVLPNASNTGIQFISFYSSNSCTTAVPTSCMSLTGTDLANSRGLTTISIDTSGDAASSIFYAYWTQVSLANSGQIGAIIGQTIRLSNSGTITFGSSVGTGQTTWVINGYRRQ